VADELARGRFESRARAGIKFDNFEGLKAPPGRTRDVGRGLIVCGRFPISPLRRLISERCSPPESARQIRGGAGRHAANWLLGGTRAGEERGWRRSRRFLQCATRGDLLLLYPEGVEERKPSDEKVNGDRLRSAGRQTAG